MASPGTDLSEAHETRGPQDLGGGRYLLLPRQEVARSHLQDYQSGGVALAQTCLQMRQKSHLFVSNRLVSVETRIAQPYYCFLFIGYRNAAARTESESKRAARVQTSAKMKSVRGEDI